MTQETEAEKWDRLLGKHRTYIGANSAYYLRPFCRCGWDGRTHNPGQMEAARAEADQHMASVAHECRP